MANTTTTQTVAWGKGYLRVLAGAPIDTNGVIANDATAIGIVQNDVDQGGTATIITAGEWDAEYSAAHAGIALSEDCRRALTRIKFTDSEGKTIYVRTNPIPDDGAVPEGDGYSYQAGEHPAFPVAENVPVSEATTIDGLKETVNALLDALKEAGLMEEDTEDTEDTE